MKPKIGLVTLGVSDLGRSRAFYRDGLGLPEQPARKGGELMLRFSKTPINAIDRGARQAFRQYCDELGGSAAAAELLAINPRTAERIYNGQHYLPPSLAREMAERARDGLGSIQIACALRLERWADYCDAARHGTESDK
jgi:catechol 2,3-dioxygenase-like lactoylglutathione lyase family enzyme